MLGSAVARALAERGDHVTVLQRRASGLGLREVRGDIADPALVARACAGQDAVIHLAAKVNVVGRRADYERVNVGGTRAVLHGCRAAGVPRLVHVSSPSVAHAGASLVGATAGPADPGTARGPYARSKAIAERLALAADTALEAQADPAGLAVVVVRPHLVWGPGDTQLVARIVRRARAGRLPIVGTGAALIDSTYLDNAVDALVAALDRIGVARGRALVVTNGEPRPVAELIGDICVAGGAARPRRRVPLAPALAVGTLLQTAWAGTGRLRHADAADPPITRFVVEQLGTAHWFDQRETRALLRWEPRVSLAEGLDRLARWYAAQT
jgi:2-alkyl-3-oxoalkanoate reductase